MKSVIVNIFVAAGLMVAGSAMAVDMPATAKKNNCTACHNIDKKGVGPSWMDVSKKYKGVTTYKFEGKDVPIQEGLAMKVKKGGSGSFGSMPMPANPKVSDADMKELVSFVLGLAQ